VKKLPLITIFFLSSLNIVLAQNLENSRIEGVIYERGTKKPLTDVGIFILPHKISTRSDAQGKYDFKEIPKGPCTIVINYPNYQKKELINVCDQDLKNFSIFLEKENYHVFETTVVSKRKIRDDQIQSLSQEEFIKMPGSFGGDPVRATQNLPGVGLAGFSAQIIVQGASPDDTGYYINGFKVPLVFHFGGLSSVVVPDAVERVDLYPSGYGPEYSKAMGGIVTLQTKTPKAERHRGMAFIDLFNTGFLFEGPTKLSQNSNSDSAAQELDQSAKVDSNSTWLVSGRYSYIGQILKKVANEEEDFKLTAAPTYYDFTAAYQNQFSSRHHFKTTLVYSRDELNLILSKAANSDPTLRGNFENVTSFYRVIPELQSKINETISLNNSLSLGQDKLFVNIGDRYLDVEDKKIGQRFELIKSWNGFTKSYLGLDNEWSWATVGVNLPKGDNVGGIPDPFSVGEKRKFLNKTNSADYGVYVRQEMKLNENSPWTFMPNVRFDYFTINDDYRIQPRLQMRYTVDQTLFLRASWGQYLQPTLPQESAENYGNPNIKSPYADHTTIGWAKDFDPNSSQGLELVNNYFYKKLHRLVVPSIQSNYVNDGFGEIFGAEIQAKYRYDSWMGQLVYTALKSRRTIPGYGRHPSEFDQTHNLNLIGSYSRNKWSYGGRIRYITGSPYTPVASATYDSDNNVYIPKRGNLFSERFSDFFQIDLRIDRKFIYDTWILTAYLDIQNLTNSSTLATAQYLDYSYDYSQKEEIQGLPILPTLGVKGEF